MKFTATLLLALTALVSAAPQLNGELDSRQTCIYDCGCSSGSGEPSPPPDTATCCASVGGTLGNGGTLCNGLTFAQGTSYARCCASPGFVCFAPRGCTPVTV
ncbi:hypothetical protein QBC40DRAFT_297793 [Triangularia verruculosa]|uniref:Uncharacterized protein n=1 Tax=Triangularia verruculosa TaxID=2587418 RepID=A0AAN7AVQ8_9PEZI|nr:hypothetical protein QBC40DRAFT_297793 [Triangularia verruculosa]